MTSRSKWVVVAVLNVTFSASMGEASNRRSRQRRIRAATSATQPDVEAQACLAAFRSAEMHVQSGHLRAAKERLLACAQPTCSKFLREQCAERFSQMQSEIPSVIPIASDDSGQPRSDVQVAIDGEALASRADGRAFSVDPGWHNFTFSADGEVFARQKVAILQGQRNRTIEVSLKTSGEWRGGVKPHGAVRALADEESSEPKTRETPIHEARRSSAIVVATTEASGDEEGAPRTRHSVLTWTLSGVGLAAVASGGLLTYWGRVDNDRLASCSPSCPASSVAHVHQLYIGADIAFAVGAAALAGATWAYLSNRSREREAAVDTALEVGVVPTRAGAVAGLRGKF